MYSIQNIIKIHAILCNVAVHIMGEERSWVFEETQTQNQKVRRVLFPISYLIMWPSGWFEMFYPLWLTCSNILTCRNSNVADIIVITLYKLNFRCWKVEKWCSTHTWVKFQLPTVSHRSILVNVAQNFLFFVCFVFGKHTTVINYVFWKTFHRNYIFILVNVSQKIPVIVYLGMCYTENNYLIWQTFHFFFF